MRRVDLHRPRASLPCLAMLLACGAWNAPAAAQAVGGEVIDATSGEALEGIDVELLDEGDEAQAREATAADGTFYVSTDSRSPATVRVRASSPGFETVVSEPIDVDSGELVELELRMAMEPIELDPIEVVARRPDPMHAATFEGALTRYEAFPSVGSRRVVLRGEPALRGASRLGEVLQQHFFRVRSCLVIHWNGEMVTNELMAQQWLDATPQFVEALEYFRTQEEAPLDYQGLPNYASGNCSVIAVWTDAVT